MLALVLLMVLVVTVTDSSFEEVFPIKEVEAVLEVTPPASF